MTGTTIDPVCGMNIDPDEVAPQSEYEGQTYHFCCTECKRIFDEDPTNYVNERTAEYATQI